MSHTRLFRADSGARWRYRVHEMLHWTAPHVRPPLVETDIAIRHRGYGDPQVASVKDQRNHRLLLLAAAEHPDDGHVLLHLARNYIGLRRFAEAAAVLEKCLTKAETGSVQHLWTFYSLVQNSIAQRRWDWALHYCLEGLKTFPGDPILSADAQKLRRQEQSGAIVVGLFSR